MKPEDIKTRTDLLAFILEHESQIPYGDRLGENLSNTTTDRKADFILMCLDRGFIPATDKYGVPDHSLNWGENWADRT